MIAIFDIGRTNKKTILFDEEYKVVEEFEMIVEETKDDDGYACQDLSKISNWIQESFRDILSRYKNAIKAVNFSTHGATLVHLDEKGKPVTPLYDYLKPLDSELTTSFYELFGGATKFSMGTGSPPLGMLNCGIQLFWLKKFKPDLFQKIKVSLHFPQYMNYLFTQKLHADYTSIGCHTGLWSFDTQSYHSWLKKERLNGVLPSAESVEVVDKIAVEGGQNISVGIGIHDSSAALLPFVKISSAPFLLLSTGTWSITLNPFFKGDLDESKYSRDCLYYLLNKTQKVAASRFLLGKEFEFQVRNLERYFDKQAGHFKSVGFQEEILNKILDHREKLDFFYPETMGKTGPCPNLKGNTPDFYKFDSFEEAYHKLLLDLIFLQKKSIELVSGSIKQLYVTGGFVRNEVFLAILQAFLWDWKIFYAPKNNRASALGAAIAIHEAWQKKSLERSVVDLRQYRRASDLDLRNYEGIELAWRNP